MEKRMKGFSHLQNNKNHGVIHIRFNNSQPLFLLDTVNVKNRSTYYLSWKGI